MTTDEGQIERENVEKQNDNHQKIFEFGTSSQTMIDTSQK